MAEFQRIGLIARLRQQEVVDTLARLVKFLLADGRTVVVNGGTAALMDADGLRGTEVCRSDEFSRDLDLAIVVGGDGSMLSAARELASHNVPMLGVNRGRLGFLTDILPEHMEAAVAEVLSGEYLLCERFLLAMRTDRDGCTIGTGLALNEVLLHPGKSVRMMDFELNINGQFVYSQRSDGLIVSTPTGSTAYALSAGGPIMHPRLDAIVLVPLNPHTLTSRPIVVDGNCEIEVRVGTRNELHPEIACDGQQELITEPGDVIRIHKSPHPLRLIHPAGQNFYELCRTKLGWGSRLDSVRHDPDSPERDPGREI